MVSEDYFRDAMRRMSPSILDEAPARIVYDDTAVEEDDCLTADMYAADGNITFKLDNFEYTEYADNIRDFKRHVWQEIEAIIDECIIASLGGRG